jgi:hypothetical protein
MLQVGFEPTIPILEQAKIGHGLDRAATVIWSNELWGSITATISSSSSSLLHGFK